MNFQTRRKEIIRKSSFPNFPRIRRISLLSLQGCIYPFLTIDARVIIIARVIALTGCRSSRGSNINLRFAIFRPFVFEFLLRGDSPARDFSLRQSRSIDVTLIVGCNSIAEEPSVRRAFGFIRSEERDLVRFPDTRGVSRSSRILVTEKTLSKRRSAFSSLFENSLNCEPFRLKYPVLGKIPHHAEVFVIR
jgi:hypothetical protein